MSLPILLVVLVLAVNDRLIGVVLYDYLLRMQKVIGIFTQKFHDEEMLSKI